MNLSTLFLAVFTLITCFIEAPAAQAQNVDLGRASSAIALDNSGNIFEGTESWLTELLAAGGYTKVNIHSTNVTGISWMAFDRNDNLFVQQGNGALFEFPVGGGYSTGTWFPNGDVFGLFAVDRNDNIFNSRSAGEVDEFFLADGYNQMKTLATGFYSIQSIAVDGSGNIFVADQNGTVSEIPVSGGYTAVNTLRSGFRDPASIAVDGSGNVFVADFSASENMGNGPGGIYEIMAAGGYITMNQLYS